VAWIAGAVYRAGKTAASWLGAAGIAAVAVIGWIRLAQAGTRRNAPPAPDNQNL